MQVPKIREIKLQKIYVVLYVKDNRFMDSDSEFANSMKILVEKKLDEGLSEKQIYKYMQIKFGDWILYDPGLSKNTYILWLLPLLIFLFGGAIIYKKLIKKN